MNAHRTPKTKEARAAPRVDRTRFTTATFEALADDLQNKRIPLDRVTVSDEVQKGLRAIIRNTGQVSFHVQYDFDGSRPYLKLGDHPAMSIADARELAKTVRTLAALRIDVQAGLHDKLIRELKEKGTRWRP